MYDLWIEDHHQQRMQFLRPLSMTCKAMRSRFLPWVWERLELPSPWSPGTMTLSRKLTALANALHTDISLATNVMYFCAPFLPQVEADSCPPKVHDGASWVGLVHLLPVRQMPKVPPKSTHFGDRMGGILCYDPTQGRAQGRQTPPDQDSHPASSRPSSSPTLL